jgi:hypothetical protein
MGCMATMLLPAPGLRYCPMVLSEGGDFMLFRLMLESVELKDQPGTKPSAEDCAISEFWMVLMVEEQALSRW